MIILSYPASLSYDYVAHVMSYRNSTPCNVWKHLPAILTESLAWSCDDDGCSSGITLLYKIEFFRDTLCFANNEKEGYKAD